MEVMIGVELHKGSATPCQRSTSSRARVETDCKLQLWWRPLSSSSWLEWPDGVMLGRGRRRLRRTAHRLVDKAVVAGGTASTVLSDVGVDGNGCWSTRAARRSQTRTDAYLVAVAALTDTDSGHLREALDHCHGGASCWRSITTTSSARRAAERGRRLQRPRRPVVPPVDRPKKWSSTRDGSTGLLEHRSSTTSLRPSCIRRSGRASSTRSTPRHDDAEVEGTGSRPGRHGVGYDVDRGLRESSRSSPACSSATAATRPGSPPPAATPPTPAPLRSSSPPAAGSPTGCHGAATGD